MRVDFLKKYLIKKIGQKRLKNAPLRGADQEQ